MATTLLLLALLVWVGWMYLKDQVRVVREMGRFAGVAKTGAPSKKSRYDHILTLLGTKASFAKKGKLSARQLELKQKYLDAGLETPAEVGSYYLLRIAGFIIGPTIGSLGYLGPSAYYGTLFFIMCTAVGVSVPWLWLRSRTVRRVEDIQRELPLLIDLTNLGTSAGWDVASSLEKVIDALVFEFPSHPLMREFRRGRVLAQTGYTWHEVLERVSAKLGNDAVRRCTLALGQAIRQGGDRTSQLEGIAQDAQRIYYAELDRRLAGMPVKAVIVTMVLLLSYFMIILAPAGIQIKNTIM